MGYMQLNDEESVQYATTVRRGSAITGASDRLRCTDKRIACLSDSEVNVTYAEISEVESEWSAGSQPRPLPVLGGAGLALLAVVMVPVLVPQAAVLALALGTVLLCGGVLFLAAREEASGTVTVTTREEEEYTFTVEDRATMETVAQTIRGRAESATHD